jgi:hypothetical protein
MTEMGAMQPKVDADAEPEAESEGSGRWKRQGASFE